MSRDQYKLFSPGRIGPLVLSNRLVRSATFDPSIVEGRKMTEAVLHIYRALAEGGVGLIITGDIPVIPEHMLDDRGRVWKDFTFDDVRIDGLDRLVDVVHGISLQCKVIAQISGAWTGIRPSDVPTPFDHGKVQILTPGDIEMIIEGLTEGIVQMQALGFDGVQLHCAHGYLLSRFLSPYANRRDDQYGGSVANRVRIIREIVTKARARVGDFPILIKMNATDNIPGGIDAQNLPALALEIEKAGVDAIEISGGMVDCLIRLESELGFPPVPIPEAHTRINHPDKESYFLEHDKQKFKSARQWLSSWVKENADPYFSR
jgi:2,4-dienoyl-CoA reductase-like NADH-dependent reductase (Old Yellow Enzyme family)